MSLEDSFNMGMLPKVKNREFPKLLARRRNLRPDKCNLCKGIMGGTGGLTLFHGRWLCNVCQEKEKRGLL